MDIIEFLKSRRPNLSVGSLKTYKSILTNLHNEIYGTKIVSNAEAFDDTETVLNHLKQKPSKLRKTILSALVVFNGSSEYSNKMIEDVEVFNKEIEEQKMDDKQKDNWIVSDDIKSIYDEYKEKAKSLYKQELLELSDLQEIQNYIILSLMSGIYIVPRRNLDYANFKIRNVDYDKDNYYNQENKTFVFNSYKTAKTYGQQVIEVPKKLRRIVEKWIDVNPTDYLLFNNNLDKLTSSTLTKRMNKIFGGNIGANQMRHTYLTDNYSDTSINHKKLENDMSKMGSSLSMASTYIKLK
jgi:integrase